MLRRLFLLLFLMSFASCTYVTESNVSGLCGDDVPTDAPPAIDASPDVPTLDAAPPDAARSCYAILIAGDSNAKGEGRVPELTGADVALAAEFPDVEYRVRLANGTANPPAWTEYPIGGVRPVLWSGIDRFGIEVTMARDLVAARPDVRWVIIKAAIGGTTLYDTWRANTSTPWVFANVHDWFDAQLAETGCTAVAYVLILGGSDALQISRANAYGGRLTTYEAAIKTRYPGIAFVDGRLHDSTAYPYAVPVQAGQDALVGGIEVNQSAATLRSDGFHFTTPSEIMLGHLYATPVLSVTPAAAYH